MLAFLGRRAVRAVLTLIGVLTIAFVLLRLNGSPAILLLGNNATPENIRIFDHAYGLDQSIVAQYLTYLGHAVQGNFGNSITYSTSALHLVLDRMPATLVLAVVAFIVGGGLALLLSFGAEMTDSRGFKSAILWIGALVTAIPSFLLGVLLILLFSVELKVLPALGGGDVQHLIMPAVTLAAVELSLYIRLFNVAIAEQKNEDYVRTAYAKGQSKSRVVLRHMLPNAVLPVLTVAGVNLGNLIGGTVIVEAVFNYPGAGHLIYSAVTSRDYPIVQVGLVVIAFFFVVINIGVDVLYAVLDPRVRLS
jgi:peptide/nickel transport system permease protein